MEFIVNVPVILKLLTVFAVILFLMRKGLSLGTALLAGSVLAGLWCRMSLWQIAQSMGLALIQSKTIIMNILVTLILILSYSMERLGQMKRMLTAFLGLIKNPKFNLIVFPALIGLLPMPGGAIFSAPMVDVLGKEYNLDAETKALINYWFRHIWETAWPLYPGFLLAASLSSVSGWEFSRATFPLFIAALVAGYIFLLRNLKISSAPSNQSERTPNLRAFLTELAPILFVILGSIGGNILMGWVKQRVPTLSAWPSELPLLLALVISIVFVWRMNKVPAAQISGLILNKPLIKMIYMITMIFGFNRVLQDSQAIVELSHFFTALHLPLLPIVVLLPLIVGLIIGVGVGIVGTGFPVLLSLLHAANLEGSIFPYLVVAYLCGYIGMMFTPLHTCFVLTQEYFQADFPHLYRRIWPLLLVMLVCVLLYFWMLTTWN